MPRTTREMSWNYQGISHCLRVVTLTVSVCLQILNSFNISGMDEATLFKFDKWVGYDGVHPGVKNLFQKGRGLGHVTLVIIKSPSTFLEWMKLHSSKLASSLPPTHG